MVISLQPKLRTQSDMRARIRELLSSDLGFHDEDSSEMSHDFHAFPAKFPPQLPRLFISHLTQPGDYVLDPMMGSGTCVLEASASGRVGIGFDIDPLAVLLTKVKITSVTPEAVYLEGVSIAERAEAMLRRYPSVLKKELVGRFDAEAKAFLDYWFSEQTQLELVALLREIEKIDEAPVLDFFKLVFSAVIITKSGGVSLAWDLAHTRPHKLKQGLPKLYRPALPEFKKRLTKNIKGLREMSGRKMLGAVHMGNAEALPLCDNSIDLLLTSPPYASNAIDYMRAHKFSLIWFGGHPSTLSDLRSQYIGGEKISDYEFLELPPETRKIVSRISTADQKKGLTLHRYYSEMKRVLAQAHRVLKPNKAAFFVVGSSTMRGLDSQTQDCLGEIGVSLGFELAGIGVRRLDRDRRMMPARTKVKNGSQIEQRMHEEHVVAFLKLITEGGNGTHR